MVAVGLIYALLFDVLRDLFWVRLLQTDRGQYKLISLVDRSSLKKTGSCTPNGSVSLTEVGREGLWLIRPACPAQLPRSADEFFAGPGRLMAFYVGDD